MNNLALALPVLALLTACGSELDTDSGETDVVTTPDTSSEPTASDPRKCAARPVRWLHEGNFWRVAWVDLVGRANIVKAEGDVDVGDYTMRLGRSYKDGDYTMFPLELSGKAEDRVAPRYSAIGSNRCGDIVGSDEKRIVPIYVAVTDRWTGNGFWGTVPAMNGLRVDKMLSGLIMDPSTYLKPPFTAIGETSWESGIGAGTGCDYYAGVGPVCGSDDPGNTEARANVEYWSETMGPVAYQNSIYNRGVREVDDRETRMEVFFFADNSDPSMQHEIGTNAIADAMPLTFQNDLSNVIVLMPEGAPGTGTVSGAGIPAEAVGMQHWFSFEVTAAMSQKSLLVFLAWTHEGSYEMSLFGAPSSTWGFVYGGSGDPMPADYLEELNIAGASNLSGTYQPGKYLLGVRRTDGGTKGDAAFTLSTAITN